MRKFFLLLLMFLIMISAYSESRVSDSNIENGLKATTQVVFNPATISHFNVGFSRNEIKNYTDEVVPLDEDGIEDLFIDGNSAINMEEIYVYWKILTFNKVSASISIPYALKGENGELDWNVNLVDGSASISSNGEQEEIDVIPSSTSFGTVGSVGLSINTENLNDGNLLPGEYIGELRLNIKTE